MCIKSRENKNITLCTDVLLKKKRKKEESWANGIFYPKSHLCLKKLFCPLHFFLVFPMVVKVVVVVFLVV